MHSAKLGRMLVQNLNGRSDMRTGIRVEYQTGYAESAYGVVLVYDEETDIVTVRDEDDYTVWSGPSDRAEPAPLEPSHCYQAGQPAPLST